MDCHEKINRASLNVISGLIYSTSQLIL
jgi:hypothetical protein